MTILDRRPYVEPEHTEAPLELPPMPVPFAMSRTDRVPAQRYYDPEFYAMENELLWPRVWQMACYLAEIPNPGDYVTYEILDKSIIVLRIDATTVRAFHNSCRHRGVEVVAEGNGNVSRGGFTCPFHGWCYGLDGANTFLYQPDLFEESNRRPEDLALVPCRVETWGGSAWINLDDNAPPLLESNAEYATFMDAWKVESLWPEWWLSCRMPTNWKLAMEAFMEGYHVMETHPQLYPKSRSRTFYRDVSQAKSSPELRAKQRSMGLGRSGEFDPREFIEAQIHFMRLNSVGMAGMTHEKDVRIAEGLRSLELPTDFGTAVGVWTSTLNDAIVAWNQNQGIDTPDLNHIMANGQWSSVNFCFPNYFLLPMLSSSSAYRIRPLGPEECLFELWSLTRYPPGQEPPAPPRPTPMAPDDPRWPPIPTQDFSNLPRQQRGLHAKGFDYMRLSNVVEGVIGNYHRLLDGYLAGLPDSQLVPANQHVGRFEIETRDIGI